MKSIGSTDICFVLAFLFLLGWFVMFWIGRP